MALWLEHRTLSRENPCSNALFLVWAISFTQRCLGSFSCINEYLVLDSGGFVDGEPLCSNCSLAECFQYKSSWRWNKQACQGVKGDAI